MPEVWEPAEFDEPPANLATGPDKHTGNPPPDRRRTKGTSRPGDLPSVETVTNGSASSRNGRPSPRRWVQRAEGDRRSRTRLRIIEGDGVVVLNDRRDPGSQTNIKWIAVSSAGVFVIDAKSYKGLVHTKRAGPIWDLGPYELHIGRRNCTSLVEGVATQRGLVRAALDTTTWGAEVPVYAILCLTRADWGFASAIEISDVSVGWPKLVALRVQAPGVMDSPAVQEVSQMIAEHLPVA